MAAARKPKPQIPFRTITRSEVPFWHPVTNPVMEPTGSQWEDALKVLSGDPESAIVLTESNRQRRGRLKSTLQTIAKNRGLQLQVRTQNEYVYAWRTDGMGRFSRPVSD